MDGNVVDKSRKCNGTEEPIYLFLIINLLDFFKIWSKFGLRRGNNKYIAVNFSLLVCAGMVLMIPSNLGQAIAR